MRSIWKGTISFGLVSIPVKLYGATEERDVSFHQVRRSDGSRIRYKRVAEADGEEVTFGDIAKGYPMPGGDVVVLTDSDFAELPLATSRAIDVLEFVPLEQVDPVYYQKSYYLEPDKTGDKPYVLLRDALERSGRVALVKVALRTRESLAVLRVRGGVFVLETMFWPDEVRTPDFAFLATETEVRPQELAMATSLIETLASDFHPEEHRDHYREALEELIQAKIAGEELVTPASGDGTRAPVLDLMAALRASVAAARGEADPAAADPAAADPAGEHVAPPVKRTTKTGPKGAAKGTVKAVKDGPDAATARKAPKRRSA